MELSFDTMQLDRYNRYKNCVGGEARKKQKKNSNKQEMAPGGWELAVYITGWQEGDGDNL